MDVWNQMTRGDIARLFASTSWQRSKRVKSVTRLRKWEELSITSLVVHTFMVRYAAFLFSSDWKPRNLSRIVKLSGLAPLGTFASFNFQTFNGFQTSHTETKLVHGKSECPVGANCSPSRHYRTEIRAIESVLVWVSKAQFEQ